MTGHDRALELAAAALDFELAPGDRRELEDHLAGCASCRRAVAEIRLDAQAVAATPVVPLPPERADAILRAALRGRRANPPLRLLAVAALFALGGGAVVAGSGLLDPSPDTPPVVVRPTDASSPSPAPAVTPTVDPETARPTPTAVAPSPSPALSPALSPAPASPAAFDLVRADAREIGTGIEPVPAGDGSTWVTVPRAGATLLFRLGADGAVTPGWPVSLPAAPCAPPLAVEDGSVRVVCEGVAPTAGTPGLGRGYALAADGQTLRGWPVDLPCCVELAILPGLDARMDGTQLVLAAGRQTTDTIRAGEPVGVSQVVTVEADGAVAAGAEIPRMPDHVASAIGPDAVGWTIQWAGSTSRITAFDADGVRPGWPIELDGQVSPPAALPDGRVAFTVASPGSGTARIVYVAPDGVPAGSSEPLPIQPTAPWTGAGDLPLGPMLVAPDGSLRVVGGGSGPEATVWAIDPEGEVVEGWPWTARDGIEHEGTCGEGETGCGQTRVLPALGPDGEVVVAMAAPDGSGGGALIVIDRDGSVRDGWPVTLNRAGSAFWSVRSDGSGVVHAVAVEPEDAGGASATVLAIDPDSTVRYATTLVEP